MLLQDVGPNVSPDVGQRTLPQALDTLASKEPDALYGFFPTANDLTIASWRRIAMKEVANAVNHLSWWIALNIGTSTNNETLAYMGPLDLRYFAMALACVKTGHKVIFPSPRNALPAQLYLLGKSSCTKFVYCPLMGRERKVHEIQEANEALRSWQLPTLESLLDTPARLYPFDTPYEQLKDQTVVIIHSSGSTGMPKLVSMTHGYFATQDNLQRFHRSQDGRAASWTSCSEDTFLAVNPAYHLLGFWVFSDPILKRMPIIVAPDRPLTADLLAQIVNTTNPTLTGIPPPVLEDISASEVGLAALAKIRTIYFGGAPMSQTVGDRICQLTRIFSNYGSTEMGLVPCFPPTEREDWNWIEFHPSAGIQFDPCGDGLFEAVVRPLEDRKSQGIFHSFPELEEYRTNDRWLPHPTKPGKWSFQGRADDVIVLGNAEKFNPTDMEKKIEEHPLVWRAIVVGEGQTSAALLFEPRWDALKDDDTEASLIEAIWPTVEAANELGPSHAQLLQIRTSMASRDVPFALTVKGNIQRRAIAKLYSEKILALYARQDGDTDEQLPADATLEQIEAYVRKILGSITSTTIESNSADLFVSGVDSLQTSQLSAALRSALRRNGVDNLSAVGVQELYSHPSVGAISKVVFNLLNPGRPVTTEEARLDVEFADQLVVRHTADLPLTSQPKLPSRDKHAVLITGSTGSLGIYLVDVCLRDPTVSHIFCLNRAEDALERTEAAFAARGLDASGSVRQKVTFWQAQFGREMFGLEESQYRELVASVDTGIHNAWAVNFNHRLESFEAEHVRGVRRFIDFSLASSNSAHLHFISSQSSFGGWSAKHGSSVPEAPHHFSDAATPSGYGLSKLVAERILALASERSGVPVTIHRVGQIAGPTTELGSWNTKEWIPLVVKTSQSLRKVPSSLSYIPVDWIPVDTLAQAISELVVYRRQESAQVRCAVFHLLNPSQTTWSTMLPALTKAYSAQVVSLESWIQALSQIDASDATLVAEYPAVKLLDFMTNLASNKDYTPLPIETSKTCLASRTMRTLPAVSMDWMELYIRQWAF